MNRSSNDLLAWQIGENYIDFVVPRVRLGITWTDKLYKLELCRLDLKMGIFWTDGLTPYADNPTKISYAIFQYKKMLLSFDFLLSQWLPISPLSVVDRPIVHIMYSEKVVQREARKQFPPLN